MAEIIRDKTGRIIFTKEMKDEYTILIPMMIPIHFELIKNIFCNCGYNMVLLKNDGPEVVSEGLKYVHNDTCYPALLVIGQMIDALNSGKYDLNKTALIITQTGGGCRASNYIHLLRKALARAGYSDIPVVSLNVAGLEQNPGFKLTLPIIHKALAAIIYGDMLMLLSNQVRPYEVNKGETDKLVASWIEDLSQQFNYGKGTAYRHVDENLKQIAASFNDIEVNLVPKVKVGVVGEIYVKYSPLANNGLEAFLASQDCEVMVPGLMNFLFFIINTKLDDIKIYGGSKFKRTMLKASLDFLGRFEAIFLEALKAYPRFKAPMPFNDLKHIIKGVIGRGAKMGEGWLLTAEMLELAEHGYENIVCTQPFGCLPNHICGKGTIRRIKEVNPKANIVAIDYDPSATKVNQENRIKLMLAVAKEELEAKNSSAKADENADEKELCHAD